MPRAIPSLVFEDGAAWLVTPGGERLLVTTCTRSSMPEGSVTTTHPIEVQDTGAIATVRLTLLCRLGRPTDDG